MSLENRESRVVNALAVDLAAAENVALLTYVASKPIMIQRFGVVANASEGILAPTQLKLRLTPVTTGTAADLGSDVLIGVAKARGLGIYKNITGPPNGLRIDAGDTVTVAVAVTSGGVSTADVFLEFWELPFAGAEIADWSKSV